MEKPFRRIEIRQWPFLICVAPVFGLYAYFSKRQIGELCLAPTMGLSTFFASRILLILQELTMNQNNVDLSKTLKLLTQPSSTSQEDKNGFGFWIRLIFCICGLTQLPPLNVWFESKDDIFILLFTIMFGIHFQWYDCALLESYRLEKPFSYSGGSAMAFSFYYGYLKLIAPGLVKRMETFRDDEGITDDQIPQKKLYILVPSSSFVFDKLEGYQQCTKTKDLKIEHVGEKFHYHKQDRGLVKGRTYKNTMYIVEYSEHEKYYILLEGATPLKTFYETCKEHNEFEKNRREVISAFYYTLKKLIKKNKEMKDIVKLIYYDDEKKEVKIPEIVKERILKKINKSKNN